MSALALIPIHSKKAASLKVCPICTKEYQKLTTDHLPMESIFQGEKPPNLITIKVCHQCNSGESEHDENIKAFISLSVAAAKDNPSKEEVFLMKSAIATFQNNNKLHTRFEKSQRATYIQRKSGLILKEGIEFSLDVVEESLIRFLSRMTRGYHFKYLGEILPLNTYIEVKCIHKWGFDWLFNVAKGTHKKVIGNNQFKFCLVQEKSRKIWSYAFYDMLHFTCLIKI